MSTNEGSAAVLQLLIRECCRRYAVADGVY